MPSLTSYGAGGVACVALALLACSSKVAEPKFTPQPQSALTLVGKAPPPARVEIVPPRPNGDAVWLDGEWTWQGRKWAWRRGRWIAPPAGAHYSPWTMTRDATGAVWFASGTWRDRNGVEIDEPEPLAIARSSTHEVTDPSGEKEDTGRTIKTPKKQAEPEPAPSSASSENDSKGNAP